MLLERNDTSAGETAANVQGRVVVSESFLCCSRGAKVGSIHIGTLGKGILQHSTPFPPHNIVTLTDQVVFSFFLVSYTATSWIHDPG